MEAALTALALAAACAAVAVGIFTARRRSARARAERERALRARSESELRRRVERVKKGRDPLALARDAVQEDPARAAHTLSRMMRQDSGEK